MKKLSIFLLMFMVIIMMTGCSREETVSTNNNKTSEIHNGKEVSIEKSSDDIQVDKSEEVKKTTVKISGYYSEPQSLNEPETLIIESEASGEYVEVVINGEIYDFEFVSLVWKDEENVLTEDKIIKSFQKLANKTIVIKTYLPEGIPFQKIKWKSGSGKDYEYIIREHGAEFEVEGNRNFFELD